MSENNTLAIPRDKINLNVDVITQLQKWQLTVGFLIALGFLLIANVAIFYSFSQSKAATTWVEQSYQVLLHLENIATKTHEHKHGHPFNHTHATNAEQVKNLASVSHDMRDKLHAELEKIQQLTANSPKQLQHLKALQAVLENRFATSDHLDKVNHEHGVDSTEALKIGDKVDQLNAEIHFKLHEIADAEKYLLTQRQQIATHKETIAVISFASAWLVALLILGITAKTLRNEIMRRKYHEAALLTAKNQAEFAFNQLQQTQAELVQAEKLAALGSLVAGIAHEINTPIGITLSSATYLHQETTKISKLYQNNELSGDELESYFEIALQSSHLMTLNCERAARLITSFKQVAVDQTSDERREFQLKPYLEEVLLSLRPQLKKTAVTVKLDCAENLKLKSYPGAIAQILTNFIVNSLLHAYEPNQTGFISVQINPLPNDEIEWVYTDDGKGIAPEFQAKIFEPFFTTKRGSGGSGLGLHVVYNLVQQTLKGRLHVSSQPFQGTTFTLRFPQFL